jgi:hypothetical protein
MGGMKRKLCLSKTVHKGSHMKRKYLVLLALVVPVVSFADNPQVTIAPVAAFSEPDLIADNIKAECNLPPYQAQTVRHALESNGFQVTVAEKDEVPSNGRFLQVRILNAVSSGNAFLGHRKQVITLVRLFENGNEVAKGTLARDSRGGLGAGFKGSCTVLERCADTLGKDIAEWLKKKIDTQASVPASAGDAASKTNETK